MIRKFLLAVALAAASFLTSAQPYYPTSNLTGGSSTCVGCAASSVLITGTGTNPVITTDTGLTYNATTDTLTSGHYTTAGNINSSAGAFYIAANSVTSPTTWDLGLGSSYMSVRNDWTLRWSQNSSAAGTSDVRLARYEPGGLFLTSNGTLGGTMKAGVYLASTAGGASAPVYSFVGDTNTGIYSAAADTIGIAANGSSYVIVDTAQVRLRNTQALTFASGDPGATAATSYLTQYAAKQLMISGDGTGATTNAGWILGYGGSTGLSAMYQSTVVPSGTTNSVLYATSAGTSLNIGSGQYLRIIDTGPVVKFLQTDTAGAGPVITAGTATAGTTRALDITQTWNSDISTVMTAFSMGITKTSASASSNFAVWSADGVPKHTAGIDGSWTTAGNVSVGGNTYFAAASRVYFNGRTALNSSADGFLTISSNDESVGGVISLPERTAPSAPAANGAYIYTEDNGAGKTRICALFSSGTAQCFATQP